jgi:hypothetical protein
VTRVRRWMQFRMAGIGAMDPESVYADRRESHRTQTPESWWDDLRWSICSALAGS